MASEGVGCGWEWVHDCVVFIYFPFTWRQFTFRFLLSVKRCSSLSLSPLLSCTCIFYCYCFLPLVQARRVIKNEMLATLTQSLPLSSRCCCCCCLAHAFLLWLRWRWLILWQHSLMVDLNCFCWADADVLAVCRLLLCCCWLSRRLCSTKKVVCWFWFQTLHLWPEPSRCWSWSCNWFCCGPDKLAASLTSHPERKC